MPFRTISFSDDLKNLLFCENFGEEWKKGVLGSRSSERQISAMNPGEISFFLNCVRIIKRLYQNQIIFASLKVRSLAACWRVTGRKFDDMPWEQRSTGQSGDGAINLHLYTIAYEFTHGRFHLVSWRARHMNISIIWRKLQRRHKTIKSEPEFGKPPTLHSLQRICDTLHDKRLYLIGVYW